MPHAATLPGRPHSCDIQRWVAIRYDSTELIAVRGIQPLLCRDVEQAFLDRASGILFG
jgi:hypothetical protein